MRRHLYVSQSGFTLFEIIACLLIFAIAVLGFQQGQSRSVRMVLNSEDRLQAYTLAQMQMTEIELKLKRQSFLAYPEEENGDFKDDKFKKFKWNRKFLKIDPSCLGLNALLGASSDNSSGGAAASAGGLLTTIQGILKNSTRIIRVSVSWDVGKKKQTATLAELYLRVEDIPALQ